MGTIVLTYKIHIRISLGIMTAVARSSILYAVSRNVRRLNLLQKYVARFKIETPNVVCTMNNISRGMHVSTKRFNEIEEDSNEDSEEGENEGKKKNLWPIYDVETSIRYMKSDAFKETYGDAKVWFPYRRNHKGGIPPKKTRKMCIRMGVMATGNPCPVCRDEYFVVHPKNVELLKHFIDPNTVQLISYTKTGVCQQKHNDLQIAIYRAWDIGTLDMPLQFMEFDYTDYYTAEQLSQTT